MKSKPLVITNNNMNNKQQYCKGCENNFPPSSFTTNGKSYRTCNTVHAAFKIIQFHDFHDFLADLFGNINIENNENQENKENLEFKFFCTVNINTLEGKNDFK